MSSSKYGSSSGRGDDPFKNTTPNSMSKKLKEPKKKRGDAKKREEDQSQRRRTQNRNSQRAYRERREQRLQELESQMQQAEMLNQTLTTAYQELRAEVDRLETEKAHEQYYASLSAGGQSTSSFDGSYAAQNQDLAEFGQGDTMWGNNAWAPEEWQPDDGSYQYQ